MAFLAFTVIVSCSLFSKIIMVEEVHHTVLFPWQNEEEICV
jgi:hypothetical protein